VAFSISNAAARLPNHVLLDPLTAFTPTPPTLLVLVDVDVDVLVDGCGTEAFALATLPSAIKASARNSTGSSRTANPGPRSGKCTWETTQSRRRQPSPSTSTRTRTRTRTRTTGEALSRSTQIRAKCKAPMTSPNTRGDDMSKRSFVQVTSAEPNPPELRWWIWGSRRGLH